MDDLINRLKTGDVDGFNDARPRRGRLELFAADLSEIKGVGADLSNAILEKADLTDADLTDAILARAILSGADLSDTKLSGILALQSKWREAYSEDSDLSDADLSSSDFSDADLHGVRHHLLAVSVSVSVSVSVNVPARRTAPSAHRSAQSAYRRSRQSRPRPPARCIMLGRRIRSRDDHVTIT